MRLEGKRALVTGGASGFGAGIVERFVAEGARVLIADLNADAAEALAARLGPAAKAQRADVSARADMEALRDTMLAVWGGADIIVNNAGVGQPPTPLEELDEAIFDRMLAVNAKSVYLAAQAFTPLMKAQGSGVFLNIASTGGVSPRPRLIWYNASKGWMITATRAMAIELAPFGLRVNAINPVAGETPLLPLFMGEDTPEVRARFLASIPMGRFCTPADVAAAAVFLCSDEASLVTGVAMEVDGGRCI